MTWIQLGSTNFYLYYTEENDLKIFITDYVTVWFLFLSRTRFLQCLKESNLSLENITDEAMIEKGLSILLNPHDVKRVETKLVDKTLEIIAVKLFGYPFKLTLRLVEGSKELYFQVVTKPLFKSIQCLKDGQLELCDLLKKKDIEIEEYKNECGRSLPPHMRTPKFAEEAFMSTQTASEEYFGSDGVPISLLKKHIEIPENTKTIKQEESNHVSIKTEIESQPNENQNNSTVIATVNVKQDPAKTVKIEPEPESIVPSHRKRIKKLNL